MDQIELKVTNRDLLGKKVRFLRRQGITPLHLFGHGIDSLALQCSTAELKRVITQAGKTRLINLRLDGEKNPRTAIIREVQTEPRTGLSLHVDFYQVKMAERVKMEVPVVLLGESPALKSKDNMLVQELNTLDIECLPAKIPASIELDLATLTEPEQAIRVKDIDLDEEIAVINDPEQILVKISVRHAEVIEEEEVLVAEEVAEEVAEAPAAPAEASLPEEKPEDE